MLTRTCTRCGETKPTGEFYLDSGKKSGLKSQCKTCSYASEAKRFFPESRDRQLIRTRERGYTEKDRARWRASAKSKRYTIPEHERARVTLRNAVRAGRVEKPGLCSECGVPGPVHGHHHDYSRPLEVEWLCRGCHGAAHRREVAHA